MKHPHPNRVVYYGENRDGVDVVLIADVGGNNKTSGVIGLAIVPIETFHATKAAEGQHPSNKAYFQSIRENIESSCGKCMLGTWISKARDNMGLHRCYAQHNYQNVSQPVAVINRTPDTLPEYGALQTEAFQELRRYAQFTGINKVRSAIVGDLGMLPVDVATSFVEACEGMEWLGYTHQWFRSSHLKSTHQASTQGPYSAAYAAIDKGWGVFHAKSGKDTTKDASFTLCEHQQGQLLDVTVTCQGCTIQCNGKDKNRNEVIDHGPGTHFRKSPAGMVALENLTIAA